MYTTPFILVKENIEKSFQKFETDSYYVGDRHRSSTKNIYGDITSRGSRVLIGYCSICSFKNL